jgi:glycerol-3-phosphate acyltransferase PlsY
MQDSSSRPGAIRAAEIHSAEVLGHNRPMLELGVKMLIAYLLGTLLGSLLLGRMRGVDIRRMGSGNAGATNAMRTQGKLFGVLVLLIDIAKGMIAVWWLPSAALPGIGIDAGVSREWLTMACGFAVIVGHVYPVWFEFRGGKGAATVIGVVAAMELRLLVPLLLTWIIALLLFGYVGLATMLSIIALVAAVLVLEPNNVPLCTFCAAVAAFVIFTHRGNIARMRAGTENRVQRLWLFRSRAAKEPV